MKFYLFTFILSFLLAHPATSSPVSGSNREKFINLRIEGLVDTIFEGRVLTRGHNVTTVSGGTHHCDGTNLGANASPGATPTSALDSASHLAHFTWDGTFSTTFDDYFITRIGDSAQTSTQFWGILVNFQFTPVGGCQEEVNPADLVLWAFDAFNKSHFLKLTGPAVVRKGRSFTVAVVDGANGTPISGATVGGQTTGPDGTATLTFTHVGLERLKAERSDSIRSNALEVVVTP